MLVKAIIILFLLIILYSLGSALFYLVRDKKKDDTRVVMALTWRIGLSMLLFTLLFIAFALGWIQPHGIVGGG
jgi:putative copper export protein